MRAENNWYLYAAALSVAFMSYFFVDIPLTNFFQPYKKMLVYNIFDVITEFGRAEVQIVPGLLIYIIFRKKKPFWGKVGLAVALSAALAGLSTDVVKFLAGRYRPNMLFSEGLYGLSFFEWKYSMVSFPSGHSATAFGAVSVLALVFRKYRWFFLIVGALVAFSRVVTLHHYFSDIIVGSAIGMASGIYLYNRMKLYSGER